MLCPQEKKDHFFFDVDVCVQKHWFFLKTLFSINLENIQIFHVTVNLDSIAVVCIPTPKITKAPFLRWYVWN